MDNFGDIFQSSIEDDYGARNEELKQYKQEEFDENMDLSQGGAVSLFIFGDEEEDDRTAAEKALGIKKDKKETKKSSIADRLRREMLEPHKYTPKEMERFREEAKVSFVRDWDYSDPYHMTDEERAKQDELNEIRKELNTVKSIYARPEPFIEAMRIVMKAWSIFAENNMLYSYDDFMKKVAEGKIVSPGITEPRLKYIHRYNLERLSMFISNPELDVNTFFPKENVRSIKNYIQGDDINERWTKYYEEFMNVVEDQEDLSPDELEIAKEHAEDYAASRIRGEQLRKLIPQDQVDDIIAYEKHPTPMRFTYLPNKYVREYNNKNAALFTRRRKTKMKKWEQELSKAINAVFRGIEEQEWGDSSGYSTASFLESRFLPHKPSKGFGIPFMGSTSNKWDSLLNDMQTEYALMDMHRVDLPTYTIQRHYMGDIVRYIENQNINVTDLSRNLYGIDAGDPYDDRSAKAKKINNRKNETKVLEKVLGLTKSKRFRKLIARREEEMSEYNDHVEAYDDLT
ncbi:MAG: hypothetical protein HDQ88_07510 [Clostridia bacterium]|nr:hypothetical protein [Clostridia bacterium]